MEKEEIKKQLDEIVKSVDDESLAWSEIAFLNGHKEDVLEYGDQRLAQWAGIRESEWNRGRLNNQQEEWADIIEEYIANNDLHGRSFTMGVALFYLLTEQWLTEEMEDEVDMEFRALLGEEVYDRLSEVGRTLPKDVAHIIDLAYLDEIARNLSGETEDD